MAENLVTFSSGLSAIRAGSVQVFDSGKKLRLGAEAASGRGLHLGWEGRSLARMDYTAGDASIEFLDSNEDTSAMLIPDESNYYAGRDSTLTLGRSSSLGTDKRGHLVLRQEASNNAPGVLELKADDGKSVFLSLWSNSSGSYDLWATTSDPGNTLPTAGSTAEKIALNLS